MNFNSFDALLITNPTNIRYLTGFVGAAPEEREAYLLILLIKRICLPIVFIENKRKLSDC